MDLSPQITQPPTPKETMRGKFILYFLLILILGVLTWWSKQPHVQATLAEWNKHSVWENIIRLVASSDKELKGESEGRINILLLGMGGIQHDGPYLTDSMMLVSLNPKTTETAVLSIPRDLSAYIPDIGWRKINNANAFGEAKQKGSGAILASQVVADTFGLPIHYYLRIDFAGFVGLIDQLGGIKINVEHAFVDNEYPTADGKVTTISFDAGEQLLSGERALQYVRSRHGSDGQGSDFARAKRQQQVIIAIKQKLLKLSNFLNPNLIIKLYQSFQNNIETNLETWEILKLANLLKNLDTNTIYHRILDTSPIGGALIETRGEDGAYLLIPKNGDYNELKIITRDLLKTATVFKEQAKIIIENGTNQPGLAEQTAYWLTNEGLSVIAYGNAETKNYPTTLIYKISSNEKPASQKTLEKLLGYKTTLTSGTNPRQNEDFLIILGDDFISN